MNYINATDSELIYAYLSNNEIALNALIKRYKKHVFRFIYSKVKDKEVTEDLFQDTFIKIINTLKKGNYNEKGKFKPWIMRIAHNLVIDYFRKHNKMPIYENTNETYTIFNLIVDEDLDIEKQFFDEELKTNLKIIINQLPENQKEVLELRIYKDLSFKEIAAITGVNINTTLGRMRYAMANLKKSVKNNEYFC